MLKPIYLPPLETFKVSCGILPSDYNDCLSYLEMLEWFCNYLDNDVIPAINNLNDVVNEYTADIEQNIATINENMNELDESVDSRLNTFMENITTNLIDIVNYKIQHDEIQISLNETYDSQNESLVLNIVANENE